MISFMYLVVVEPRRSEVRQEKTASILRLVREGLYLREAGMEKKTPAGLTPGRTPALPHLSFFGIFWKSYNENTPIHQVLRPLRIR